MVACFSTRKTEAEKAPEKAEWIIRGVFAGDPQDS